MLIRFFICMLAILFSFSVFAAPNSGIKQAFDEFTFAMEVEGGFHNPEVGDKAKAQFEADIQKLLDSGFSRKELLEESLEMVVDETIRNKLKDLLQMLQERLLTEEQFFYQLDLSLSSTYKVGANWKWDVVIGYGTGITLFLALIIIPRVIFNFNCLPEDRTGDGVCREE